MATVLRYQEARELIKDGDIVFVRSGNDRNLLHGLVKLCTKSDYYHTLIAFWMTDATGIKRLFCVEAHQIDGRRVAPLSDYEGREMDIIAAPLAWEKISAKALDRVGHVSYGYVNYVKIGLHELVGLNFKKDGKEVCSQMVADTLAECGYNKLQSTFVSPGELARELIKAGETLSVQVIK